MTRTSFGDQIQQMWHTRPVRLPRQGPIAGVAAGFGLRYGVDPVLLRVAFVVSTIFGGAGIVLYLLAWLVLSSAGNEASAAQTLSDHARSSHSQTKTIVLIVALAIAVSTMGPIGLGMGGSGVLSMGLMLAGWWMLYLRHPELPAGFDAYRIPPQAGYPAAGYPTGSPVGAYPYRADVSTGMYTPYTKLPDAYVPDPATTVLPREETRTDTAESTPLLRVDSTETIVLHKDTSTSPDSAGPTETTSASADSATIETATDTASPSAPVTTESPSPAVGPAGTEEVEPFTSGTTGPITADPATDSPAAEAVRRDASDDSAATRAVADSSPNATATPAQPARPVAPVESTSAVDLDKPEANSPEPAGRPDIDPGPPDGGATAVLHKDPRGPRLAAQVPQGWDPLAVAPLAWELPEAAPRYAPVAPPPPPAPKRPRSRLTPVTIGLAILAAALAGAAAASGLEWMTPARIAAIALAVVGLGLIAGAFLRRGYGLLVLTAPLAGFVLLASLIGPIEFDGATMGERTWAPTSVTELEPSYAVNMGSGTLDLRGMTLTENRAVEVSVNMGEAIVLLPESMTVRTTCEVRAGDAAGCVEGLTGPKTPDAPVLDLKVDVRMGSAEVNRG
ncbi:PspC domain-containing protein [Nocardia sp. NPDC059177]|uniref:PspC domain-containing protein n=1 Tax=Nocardia sp. NPDC059177 TaxID=3346759 RepID=UPI0036897A58